jgi:hypothetical protein
MLRERAFFLLLAILVSFAVASPALAQQPPPGYQFVSGAPHVSGGILVARPQGAAGAVQLLNEGFRDAARFFGRRPEAIGGFADTRNQYAEAPFRATIGQAPLIGVAFAVIEGGSATLALAFDSPNTFLQVAPRLLQLAGLAPASDNCPPPGDGWQMAPYPDGSGQIMLPAGWRITSANMGAVEAAGPHGYIAAALWFQAVTRAGAAQKGAALQQYSNYLGVQLPQAQLVVVDPTDPGAALIGIRMHLAPILRQLGVADFRNFHLLRVDRMPVQTMGFAQAGMVQLEFQENGLPRRGLAYVMLSSVDYDGGWLYWETGVSAPSDCFAQNLPTLLQIAGSARTADHVLQARIKSAVDSINAVGDMQYRGYRRDQAKRDASFGGWRENFIGVRVVEDTRTGTQSTVEHGHSTELVRRLNEQEPGRYREIPLRELSR